MQKALRQPVKQKHIQPEIEESKNIVGFSNTFDRQLNNAGYVSDISNISLKPFVIHYQNQNSNL